MRTLLTRWTLAAVTLALAGAGGAWALRGGSMFSPGPLSSRAGQPLGGVRSHAQLAGRCSACHAAPWSGPAMDARCLACHTDIQAELKDSTRLHASLGDAAAACRSCHGEHGGAAGSAALALASTRGAHARFGFPLEGAHARAACRGCHAGVRRLADYRAAPTRCVACHQEDDAHRGGMGADCAACHGAATWKGARFDHSFPLDHGSRTPVACAVCHPAAPGSYRTYTCYGCHEHTPARIEAKHSEEGVRNLTDCVRCHAGGREHEGGGGGEN